MLRSSLMARTSKLGPASNVVLIRCLKGLPGIWTQRSRGIDRIDARVFLGSTWTKMMVSERWPVTGLFLSLNCGWPAARAARLSLPTTNTVNGLPGGESDDLLRNGTL